MSNKAIAKRSLLIAALLLLAALGAWGYWLARGAKRGSVAGRPVPTPDFDFAAPPASNATGARPDDLLITIQPDKLANAQFKLAAAVTLPGAALNAGGLRATGTVEANAYKVVPVLPIAGGIVREVNFVLGDRVERGQKLATIFSTDLAEAQTAYLSLLAEIERHHQHYNRTAQLAEIGAVSREELEEANASYKIEQARLHAARQRLLLLGMHAKQIDELRHSEQMSASITVEAPAAGVLLSRTVNAGEVVALGKELFRIADLSTVWVIGQIYEKDFAAVRLGAPATITAPAYPGRRFAARVSYLDPRVEPQTRTAQVRIEVRNPGESLKLGMFVDVHFGDVNAAHQQTLVGVPPGAVQMIGGKQVVFVATNQPGAFAQREVKAGAEANGLTAILAGLQAGERVVSEGGFLLRAESLKLHPQQLTAPAAQSQPGEQTPALPQARPANTARAEAQPVERVQAVTVTLTEKGYQPSSFKLRRGVPARVTFVRKAEATCGTEIVLADYQIKRELPLNKAVTVAFTPVKTGEFKFACGMDMLRGSIVIHQ
jgi:RND family efflux transporter MFP subunit